jgi:hypothetical protein
MTNDTPWMPAAPLQVGSGGPSFKTEESIAPLKKRGKEAKGERSLRLSLTHVELLVGQHLLLEGKLQRGGLNTEYLSGGHGAYICTCPHSSCPD